MSAYPLPQLKQWIMAERYRDTQRCRNISDNKDGYQVGEWRLYRVLCCKRIRTRLLAIKLWREPAFLGTVDSWSSRVSALENMNRKVCRLETSAAQSITHLSRKRSFTMSVRWIHTRQRNINWICRNLLSNIIYHHCSSHNLLGFFWKLRFRKT